MQYEILKDVLGKLGIISLCYCLGNLVELCPY